MADPRFFKRAGPFTLKELAALSDSTLESEAEGDRLLHDVAPLDLAGPEDLSFLDNKRYLPAFAESRAGAAAVDPAYAARAPAGTALLLTKTPYKAYALIAQAFYPRPEVLPGVHPTAVVDATASVDPTAALEAFVVVGPRAEVGAGCHLRAHAVIGEAVVVGEGSEIGSHSSLSHCLVGRNCLIHAGVRIGGRGFGFALDPSGYVDVPQLGRVVIEDEVEIGANSTLDRGAGRDTLVGRGSKIDNLVQLGHNVQIGRGCVLVAQSGIAGSSTLGDRVMVAAQAGIAGHLKIGSGAQIAAKSGVMRDIEAGGRVAGIPSMPIREFFRLVSLWQRQVSAQGEKG